MLVLTIWFEPNIFTLRKTHTTGQSVQYSLFSSQMSCALALLRPEGDLSMEYIYFELPLLLLLLVFAFEFTLPLLLNINYSFSQHNQQPNSQQLVLVLIQLHHIEYSKLHSLLTSYIHYTQATFTTHKRYIDVSELHTTNTVCYYIALGFSRTN